MNSRISRVVVSFVVLLLAFGLVFNSVTVYGDSRVILTESYESIIEGRIVNEYGDPIKDAGVTVYSEEDRYQVFTDELGSFNIEVKPGVYSIFLKKDGYIDKYQHHILIGDTDVVMDDMILSKRVYGSVEGRVLDTDGNPVSDYIISFTLDEENKWLHKEFTTDESGYFSGELLVGNYLTDSWKNYGYRLLEIDKEVKIIEGDILDLTVLVQELKYGEISGQVKDQDGSPVAFADVTIYELENGREYSHTSTQTDEDGHYKVRAEEGEYNVSVTKKLYSEYRYNGLVVKEDENHIVDATIEKLSSGFLKGSIVDEDNIPLENAEVQWRNRETLQWGSFQATENGEINFSLETGEYIFKFSHPSSDVFTFLDHVSITEDEVKDIGEIVLDKSKKYQVSGRVVDEDGVPVTNASISLMISDHLHHSVELYDHDFTSENGEFTLTAIDGYSSIMIKHDDYYVYSKNLDEDFDSSEIVIERKIKAEFSLEVQDGSGNPLKDADVWLMGLDRSNNYNVYTDSNGVVSKDVGIGPYLLRIMDDGSNWSYEAEIDILEGQENKFNVTMEIVHETSLLKGTVRDDNGNPVSAASVTAYSNTGHTIYSDTVCTDIQGFFSMNLPVGSYTLYIYDHFFRVKHVNIILDEEDKELNINIDHKEEAVRRIAGSSRFETAESISQDGWTSSDAVILTDGTKFPDALAGGPLAYLKDAPILLTRPDRLSDGTINEIQRLGANKIYILGGYAAVSADVEELLISLGYEIKRLNGVNRYDTAVVIGEEIIEANAVDTVILATGDDYPDALSIAPMASREQLPILFSRVDRLDIHTKEAIIRWNIKNVNIVGGKEVISELVEQELEEMGVNVQRTFGSDRYLTSLQIAKENEGMGYEGVIVSTGQNFADAF